MSPRALSSPLLIKQTVRATRIYERPGYMTDPWPRKPRPTLVAEMPELDLASNWSTAQRSRSAADTPPSSPPLSGTVPPVPEAWSSLVLELEEPAPETPEEQARKLQQQKRRQARIRQKRARARTTHHAAPFDIRALRSMTNGASTAGDSSDSSSGEETSDSECSSVRSNQPTPTPRHMAQERLADNPSLRRHPAKTIGRKVSRGLHKLFPCFIRQSTGREAGIDLNHVVESVAATAPRSVRWVNPLMAVAAVEQDEMGIYSDDFENDEAALDLSAPMFVRRSTQLNSPRESVETE